MHNRSSNTEKDTSPADILLGFKIGYVIANEYIKDNGNKKFASPARMTRLDDCVTTISIARFNAATISKPGPQ